MPVTSTSARWPIPKVTTESGQNGLVLFLSGRDAREERRTLRRVWNDGHKVIGNDRQIVTIDTKLLYSLCSCVDQAQTMDFARTEPEVGDSCVVAALCLITGGYLGAVEVVSALDQIVVG
jgi:hypothetical protein